MTALSVYCQSKGYENHGYDDFEIFDVGDLLCGVLLCTNTQTNQVTQMIKKCCHWNINCVGANQPTADVYRSAVKFEHADQMFSQNTLEMCTTTYFVRGEDSGQSGIVLCVFRRAR